jgi:hypothetical protein
VSNISVQLTPPLPSIHTSPYIGCLLLWALIDTDRLNLELPLQGCETFVFWSQALL